MSDDLLDYVINRVALYAALERDARGFIGTNGWAHAFTHIGNAVNEIMLMPRLMRADTLPKYRDTGAFFFLSDIIQNQLLSESQMRWLITDLVSDEQLFAHIFEVNNAAIYRRSFSVLLVSLLVAEILAELSPQPITAVALPVDGEQALIAMRAYSQQLEAAAQAHGGETQLLPVPDETLRLAVAQLANWWVIATR
ncbi:DUF2785 domain-containing protein|uniref:DUF2785 domain-containing protein n=1 Tax=Leuconostoc lactis TaxID=1246 RepID=A0A6L7ADP0_LEULA|nr:DUF2785 domain-containing protein [Leuconostoc lactis]